MCGHGSTRVHVGLTLDGSQATLYVNGAVDAQLSTSFIPKDMTVTPSNFWIGRSTYPQDAYYGGYVRDWRVYERPLRWVGRWVPVV